MALALAVALSGIAYADSVSLYTPPMMVSVGKVLRCLIANVGDQIRTVSINSGTPTQLLPGQSVAPVVVGIGDPGCSNGGCPAYCVFTVQGGKHNFRAAICVEDSAEIPFACLPAE